MIDQGEAIDHKSLDVREELESLILFRDGVFNTITNWKSQISLEFS